MPVIHIRKGRVLDPGGGDRELDLLIRDGRIERAGKGLKAPSEAQVVDAAGAWVVPGLVDLRCQLGEPGEEYKEDLASGLRAAAAGGFTAVCAMPQTRPPNDNRTVTELLLQRANAVKAARLFPVGALTRGLEGEVLTEVGELKDAGVVALGDGARSVSNSRLMRRAMEYARTFGLPVFQHAQDAQLSEGAVMHEGRVSTRLGLRGSPAETETVMVARDLELVALTGARYHLGHVSTRGAVERIREAKRRGLPVTCEVSAHHLLLTDEACAEYDPNTKLNPPLRSEADRAALLGGVRDGTIDAIVSDHRPQGVNEKLVEFDQAHFGASALETVLPLVLSLVRDGGLSMHAAMERLSSGPAKVLGLPPGTLAEGAVADLTLVDPEHEWEVTAQTLLSKGKNSPLLGRRVRGRAVMTWVGGAVVFDARTEVAS